MKRIVSLLSILIVLLALGSSALYADEPEPPITPLPPKEGADTGYVEHTVTVTIGEEGKRVDEEQGYLEHVVSRPVDIPSLDQTVHWECRSSLRYSDYGEWEEVQAKSDNWTDTSVYRLQVTGKLDRNGDNLWSNTVSSGPGTTYVSSGYSLWYSGYNAFWQSMGDHFMWATEGSQPDYTYSKVSHQF